MIMRLQMRFQFMRSTTAEHGLRFFQRIGFTSMSRVLFGSATIGLTKIDIFHITGHFNFERTRIIYNRERNLNLHKERTRSI